MKYPIGIEMTEEYLSCEVQLAAMKLVKDVMLVKPGGKCCDYSRYSY